MNIEKTYGDYFKIIKNQDGYRIIDLQEQFKSYWVTKIIGDKKISEKHYETLLEAENMIFTLYQKYIDVQRKCFEDKLKEKPIKEEFVFVGETVNEKLVNELKHITVSLGVIIFLFVLSAIILWFGGLNRL